jgi:peptide/nickel transport system substrate-binding protein
MDRNQRARLLDAAPTRRGFVRGAAAGGALLGAAGLLSACGGDSGAAGTAGGAAPAGPPRRGGQLRVGMVGGGKSESFNPSTGGITLINVAMVCAVFDSLVRIGPDLSVQPALATRWERSADARTWTFTLRDGVSWHDGKPFTAEDVIYSLRWMARPGNGLANSVANVDLGALRRRGDLTVVVALKRPDVIFPTTIASSWIVQRGATDFTRPVGTGPFRFRSLSPGQQSVCDRNDDYWDDGKPYVDSLVIQSLNDDTARMNALLAGQIDVMGQIPYAQAKAQASRGAVRLLDSPSTASQSFYMRVDKAPFDDPGVRLALKLAVDRKALIDTALQGYGQVANDLNGRGLQFYDDTLEQRAHDPEQARALLARAGRSGLSVTLQTSPAIPGMVEAATLFAQQAKASGIAVKVSQVPANTYFDPTLGYLKMPFAQTLWTGISSLSAFYDYAISSRGTINETHWNDPRTDALLRRANNATTEEAAAAAWAEVQRQQWEEGGYVTWANVNNLDATTNRVAGITPSRYLLLGLPTGFADAWLT